MATRHADERVKTGRALRACVDLLDTADWLEERMSRQLENFDLTLMEFRVLETLQREGPMYQQALSRKFKCSKQSVAFVLKRLLEEGWIRRVPSALARTGGDGGRGEAVVVAEDGEPDREFGPVPSKWVEKIEKYWKTFRPRMYVQLEDSGRLRKVAVKAVVAMRVYMTNALEEGQDGRAVMEGARERFFFLRREITPAMERRAEKKAAKAKDERVPEDVVVRIKEHWRRFLPDGYAEYQRSGALEKEAMEQAIRARDSFLKMRTQRFDVAGAWEEVRKLYRSLPEGYEEKGNSKLENGKGQEPLAADFREGADPAEERNSDQTGGGEAEFENRNSRHTEGGQVKLEIQNSEIHKTSVASEENSAGAESFEEILAGEDGDSEGERRNSVTGSGRPHADGQSAAVGGASTNKEGRPVVALQLTPVGDALIADVIRKHEKAVKAYLRVLDGREQQRLSKLCRKLRKGDAMKFLRELMMEEAEE